MIAVRALDEDCLSCHWVRLQVGDERIDIGISRERCPRIVEAMSHKAHIGQPEVLQHLDYLLVLGIAVWTELTHLAEDESLVRQCHLVEVVYGSRHACRVGVVSVYYE